MSLIQPKLFRDVDQFQWATDLKGDRLQESANGDITFEYLKDLTAAGINDITTGQQIIDNRIYTLDGRYVGTDREVLPHGIYIQNRRKFIK